MPDSPRRLTGSGPEPFDACPDGGRCWHGCPMAEPTAEHPEGRGLPCWRVVNAGPFSDHPGDTDAGEWTAAERAEHGARPLPVTEVVTEYAVNGGGYVNERRHPDDARMIVASRPGTALVTRTVTTTTTPWEPVEDEPEVHVPLCDTPGPGHDCVACQA